MPSQYCVYQDYCHVTMYLRTQYYYKVSLTISLNCKHGSQCHQGQDAMSVYQCQNISNSSQIQYIDVKNLHGAFIKGLFHKMSSQLAHIMSLSQSFSFHCSMYQVTKCVSFHQRFSIAVILYYVVSCHIL